jgi:predicted GNAT superfamily acetyltransferase
MQARNAHFNLNRLGVTVKEYADNFYGTDYPAEPYEIERGPGIDSDRLFAEWELDSERVASLRSGSTLELGQPSAEVIIPPDWQGLVRSDPRAARSEQLRVRGEFARALESGLVCKAFHRDETRPRYLFYDI